MANKRPKLVEVEWLDARSIYEQMELSVIANKCHLCLRFTAGYIVHKDRERLVVAGTFDPAEKKIDPSYTPDDDGAADFTVIPRIWIKNIIVLEPAAAQEKEET